MRSIGSRQKADKSIILTRMRLIEAPKRRLFLRGGMPGARHCLSGPEAGDTVRRMMTRQAQDRLSRIR